MLSTAAEKILRSPSRIRTLEQNTPLPSPLVVKDNMYGGEQTLQIQSHRLIPDNTMS